MTRHWYDSFPGVKVVAEHPIVDFFNTPYGGPENPLHADPRPLIVALDALEDIHAPYTTASQNRGGIS